MINFDAVDFSKCRSEEVISFFWRSVYLYHISHSSLILESHFCLWPNMDHLLQVVDV